jgi:hypothetical protein
MLLLVAIYVVLPVISVPAISPVLQGQELRLQCNINSPGNPTVYTYRWEFTPKYPDGTTNPNLGSNAQLTITNTQIIHAGTYICITQNEAGDTTASNNVVVHCKLNCQYIKM